MKKITLLSLALFIVIKGYSQDYLISFVAEGASTTYDSILVENLTQDKNIVVPGNSTLRLKADNSSLYPLNEHTESTLNIYPNPGRDYILVEFEVLKDRNAICTIIDAAGRQVAQLQSYLTSGKHSYSISGLGKGVYNVIVKTDNNNFTGTIISNSDSKRAIQIGYNPNPSEYESFNTGILKSTYAEIAMQYNIGDLLKFTGMSGQYSTVFMDTPAESKTITFTFYSCTDGDYNHYPIVNIGTQIWMAENLKTTKYNDGNGIHQVTDATEWDTTNAAAYCSYNNTTDTDTINTYGRLYNLYAVNTGKLCPTGWHVPDDADWSILLEGLDGDDYAGGKLKDTGTKYWLSPNTGADNSSGFTALPGGFRTSDGGYFFLMGYYGYWWSATGEVARKRVNYDDIRVYTGAGEGEKDGYSVRCIMD